MITKLIDMYKKAKQKKRDMEYIDDHMYEIKAKTRGLINLDSDHMGGWSVNYTWKSPEGKSILRDTGIAIEYIPLNKKETYMYIMYNDISIRYLVQVVIKFGVEDIRFSRR